MEADAVDVDDAVTLDCAVRRFYDSAESIFE